MLVHTLDNFIRIYCHINANIINNTTNNSLVFKYHAKNVSVFKFSVYEMGKKKKKKVTSSNMFGCKTKGVLFCTNVTKNS